MNMLVCLLLQVARKEVIKNNSIISAKFVIIIPSASDESVRTPELKIRVWSQSLLAGPYR